MWKRPCFQPSAKRRGSLSLSSSTLLPNAHSNLLSFSSSLFPMKCSHADKGATVLSRAATYMAVSCSSVSSVGAQADRNVASVDSDLTKAYLADSTRTGSSSVLVCEVVCACI